MSAWITHIAAFLTGMYFAVICYRVRRLHNRYEDEFKTFERRVKLGIDPTYTVESKELADKVELHEN